jgi:hypothetical protein
MLDFTGTQRNGCALTGANTISKMALLACWLVLLVTALLILALGAMAIALLSLGTWEVINRGLVVMIAILMAVYMAITMTLRCPACRRRFLIESRGLKHSAALKRPHFGHWGTTVLDVVQRHQFVCMYCGMLCRVKKVDADHRPH